MEEENGFSSLDFHLDDDEDIVGRLGYGIHSYFNMIKRMAAFFLVLAFLYLPLTFYYHNLSGHGMKLKHFTLGQLGEARNICKRHPIQGYPPFSCQVGRITAFPHFGVYQVESDDDLQGRC